MNLLVSVVFGFVVGDIRFRHNMVRLVSVIACIAAAAASSPAEEAPTTTQEPSRWGQLCGGVSAVYCRVCEVGSTVCESVRQLTPEQRWKIMQGVLRVLRAEDGRAAVVAGEAVAVASAIAFNSELAEADQLAVERAVSVVVAAESRTAALGREALRGAGRIVAGLNLTDEHIDGVLTLELATIAQLGESLMDKPE